MVKIYSCYNVPHVDPMMDDVPSMTKQSFAREADINHIMARYEKTGSYYVDPMFVPSLQPSQGDFTRMDFYEAQEFVNESYNQFHFLPAHVRERFANDPGKLLSFLSDRANLSEAIKLGLVDPKSVQQSTQQVSVEDMVVS